MPNIHGRELSRRELARRLSRLDSTSGVRLVTLGDGAERGVRALEFRTGTGLDFDVLVDRCMDVGGGPLPRRPDRVAVTDRVPHPLAA